MLYRAIQNIRLSVSTEPIKGEVRWFSFIGGVKYPVRRTGLCNVTDKDEIEWLDNHKSYGKLWERVEGDEVEVEEPEETTKSYPEVVNTQGAKSVLMKEYDIPANKIPNKKAIQNRAKKLDIEFPNWE